VRKGRQDDREGRVGPRAHEPRPHHGLESRNLPHQEHRCARRRRDGNGRSVLAPEALEELLGARGDCRRRGIRHPQKRVRQLVRLDTVVATSACNVSVGLVNLLRAERWQRWPLRIVRGATRAVGTRPAAEAVDQMGRREVVRVELDQRARFTRTPAAQEQDGRMILVPCTGGRDSPRSCPWLRQEAVAVSIRSGKTKGEWNQAKKESRQEAKPLAQRADHGVSRETEESTPGSGGCPGNGMRTMYRLK
jgi:hypothetical protein